MKKNNNLDNIKIKKGEKIALKPFKPEQFEAMCRIHCTEKEILDVLEIKSHDTLNTKLKEIYGRGFEDVYEEFKSQGKMSLRRNQWRMSENNPTMAIWLGKQELGQRDKSEEYNHENIQIEIIYV